MVNAPLKLLIVEDDDDARDTYLLLLAERAEITMAKNVAEVRASIDKADAVIVDHQLLNDPGLNELLDVIRDRPALFITNHDRHLFDRQMIKPYKTEHLLIQVESLLKSALSQKASVRFAQHARVRCESRPDLGIGTVQRSLGNSANYYEVTFDGGRVLICHAGSLNAPSGG